MRTDRLSSADANVTNCAVSSAGVGTSHGGTLMSRGVVKYLVEYAGPVRLAVADSAEGGGAGPALHAASVSAAVATRVVVVVRRGVWCSVFMTGLLEC
jgi:hypothetical protein